MHVRVEIKDEEGESENQFYCNNESLIWSCPVSVAKYNSQSVQK
jgi:hypothetical protein